MTSRNNIINLILESGLFDSTWYSKQVNANWQLIDPINHFMDIGAHYYISPSKEFDVLKYVTAYPDSVISNMNPLYHYLSIGQKKGYKKFANSDFFDAEDYSGNINYEKNFSNYISNNGRIAIFDAKFTDNIINSFSYYYIEELYSITDGIVLISSDYLPPQELIKIKQFLIAYECGPSKIDNYIRGINICMPLLDSVDELIFCNTDFVGPLESLSGLIKEIDSSQNKTKNAIVQININGEIFEDTASFFLWRMNFVKHLSCNEICSLILNMDTVRTKRANINISQFNGAKYFTVNPLKADNIFSLDSAKERLENIMATICHKGISNLLRHSFLPVTRKCVSGISVIIPVYESPEQAINIAESALLAQNRNIELIFADNGSSNSALRESEFYLQDLIENKRVRYLHKNINDNCAEVINSALENAKYDWILHLSQDYRFNDKFFMSLFQEIHLNPDCDAFYIPGRATLEELDIISFSDRGGEFFTAEIPAYLYNKRRWTERLDINLGLAAEHVFLNKLFTELSPKKLSQQKLEFNAPPAARKAEFKLFEDEIGQIPIVTDLIFSKNSESTIERALKSAMMQTGGFRNCILIADDGSTDQTHNIIEVYVNKYPDLFIDISTPTAIGRSAILKRAIEAAAGDFICFMEASDYWTDIHKINDQLRFMLNNRDCAFCTSGHFILDEKTMEIKEPLAQTTLPQRFSAELLIDDFDILGGLSGVMIRKELLVTLPRFLLNDEFSEISLAAHAEIYGRLGFLPQRQFTRRLRSSGQSPLEIMAMRAKQLRDAAIVAQERLPYDMKRRNFLQQLRYMGSTNV